MVNNFDLIAGHLEFKNEKTFYFVQILKRKKENKDQKSYSRPIESFYVFSKDELMRKMPYIIEKCEMNRARAYIKMNALDIEMVGLGTISTIVEYIRDKKWRRMSRSFNSACGKCGKQDGFEKLYLIDLDDEYADRVDEIVGYINSLQPYDVEDKIKLIVPTQHGKHLITTGFQIDKFRQKYPAVDFHKDGNTILYFPECCSDEPDDFDLNEDE